MKTRFVLAWMSLALVLAACAPVARTVPAEPAVAYAGAPADVLGVVVEAIAVAPPLDDSTGWNVVYSDVAAGNVIAETEVTTPAWFLRPESTRTERVTVVVTPAGDGSQVVLQRTSGAESLTDHITSALLVRFGTR
jgi:hypothetical protein